MTALLRVTRVDAQGFVLDTDAGFGDAMVARLKKFLLRSKVEIERLPWRCLALRGAGVGAAAAGLLTVLEENGVLRLPYEWNGWSGIDLLGPKDVILDPAAGAMPEGIISCDRDAVEACRIVSGIPAMGSELTDKTIAAEAGLVDRSVSFTKGCYTGQELVARLDARGNNVPRRLVGVIGGAEPDGALAFGMTLHAGDAPDGGPGAPTAPRPRCTTKWWERSRPLPGAPSSGHGSPWPTCTGRSKRPAPYGCARATASGARIPARVTLVPITAPG